MPLPSPGDILDPGIELASLAFPALAGRFFTTEPLGKPCVYLTELIASQVCTVLEFLQGSTLGVVTVDGCCLEGILCFLPAFLQGSRAGGDCNC